MGWACLLLSVPPLLSPVPSAAEPAFPPAPATLRVLAYNLYNFAPLSQPQIKSAESRQAVISVIAALDPDIAVLTEVGGSAALGEIRGLLRERGKEYPFWSVVEGFDTVRRICLFSRFTPARVDHNVDAAYNLRGRRLRVRRGFAHCVFEFDNGYRLHLLGAHLKSKHFDPLGQTDMRRYESRLLRYMFNDIIDADPEANVLLVGDLNDTPEASPISTICGRRYKTERQLYDLRPVDEANLSWTHHWDRADSYTRIDYAFASYFLLGEVVFAETKLPSFNDWSLASDHRPVLVTLTPRDKPPPEDVLARFERNFRQPEPLNSSFYEGRIIGKRKVRRK